MMSSCVFKEDFERRVIFFLPNLAKMCSKNSGQKEAAQNDLSFLCGNCELALFESLGSRRVKGVGL